MAKQKYVIAENEAGNGIFLNPTKETHAGIAASFKIPDEEIRGGGDVDLLKREISGTSRTYGDGSVLAAKLLPEFVQV